MTIRTYTFGVRFRKGFHTGMLARQAGIDRYVHNRLLEVFRGEYHLAGRVNTTRGRINAWYTILRNASGPRWLRQSVSGVTRQTLLDLGRHYGQYVEIERAKAAGIKPETEWGEPHFKKRGDRISIPLMITHDNTVGDARFTGERTIRIHKMGDIALSRPFPVPNYRPKTARLFQTADGKWRITVSCDVPEERQPVTEPVVIGVDRNVGNIATPDHVVEPPSKMLRRMVNAEHTAARAQRIASRRQHPQKGPRKPGSRRWARAAKRAARQKRRAANIRKTISHKISRALADGATHVALEKLPIQNMTKSAKGTADDPGTSVRQKAGLNRSILAQNWGMLSSLLSYKLAGGIVWVDAAYTSVTCHACLHVDGESRRGRVFTCVACGHLCHADRNAGANIQAAGMRRIGRNARRGGLKLRHEPMVSTLPAVTAGSAHVKGRLDAEGSGISLPMKRQVPTGARPSGTVLLWHDV